MLEEIDLWKVSSDQYLLLQDFTVSEMHFESSKLGQNSFIFSEMALGITVSINLGKCRVRFVAY